MQALFTDDARIADAKSQLDEKIRNSSDEQTTKGMFPFKNFPDKTLKQTNQRLKIKFIQTAISF